MAYTVYGYSMGFKHAMKTFKTKGAADRYKQRLSKKDSRTPYVVEKSETKKNASRLKKQLERGIQCKSVRIKRVNGALRVEIKK